EGTSVQQTYDNGFIILGHTSGGPSYSDFYLIKLNYFGDTLWTRRYGGALHDIGKSVIQTSDSGYLMTGESFSFSQGDVNLYLIKTNEQGDTLWTTAYGGLDSDAGYSIVQSYDMNYLIAGFTTSSFQNAGLCLLKINQTGDSLWTKVFDKCYLGNCIIQAKDSSIIVVGESAGVGL
ncbi:MAG: hypothetical protein NTV09_12150, partial [Bacteroidetes bacterium]|nr:hypothetical protein [Bacteroidota bacterium]